MVVKFVWVGLVTAIEWTALRAKVVFERVLPLRSRDHLLAGDDVAAVQIIHVLGFDSGMLQRIIVASQYVSRKLQNAIHRSALFCV